MQFKKVISKIDIEQVAALAKTIWTEYYTDLLPKGQAAYMIDKFQSAIAIEKQIAEGHHYFFLEEDEIPIGYLDFVMQDETCFISKIYLIKEERGKGLGTIALNFIEEQAKALNAKKLQLTVNKNNIPAFNAYLRADFQNVGPIQIDIGNGFVMDDYKMEKAL